MPRDEPDDPNTGKGTSGGGGSSGGNCTILHKPDACSFGVRSFSMYI